MAASGQQGIRAGRAFVELTADDSMLRAGLRRAQRHIQMFGASLSKIGASFMRFGSIATAAVSGMLAPLGLAVREASNLQETINRFDAIFGENAEAVEEWAQRTSDAVGRFRGDLQTALSEFGGFFTGLGFDPQQTADMSKRLTALALDFASFNNMSDEEATGRFISALSGSAEVLDRFGINAKQAAIDAELLRMGFEGGAAAATEAQKAIARLNIIMRAMTDQGAVGDAEKTAGSFTNRLKAAQSAVKEFAASVGEPLLSPLAKLLGRFAGVSRLIAGFVRQNPAIVTTFATVGAGALALSAAIFGIGVSLKLAGFALSGFAGLLGLAAKTLGLIGAAVAFLVSPLGLVTAAVVGLGAAFLTLTTPGRAVVAFLMEQFGMLAAFFQRVWGGIRDAIAGGDLKLAGEVAMAGLRVAWERGTLELRKVWEGLKGAVLKTWEGLVHGLLAAWEHVVYGVSTAWTETVAGMKKLWADFSEGLKSAWEITINWTSKRAIDAMQLAGELTPEEAEQAKADLQRDSDARLSGIVDESARARREAEQQRADRRQEIDREFERNLSAIGQAFEDAIRAIDAAGAEKLRQSQAELDQARRNLEEAIAEARRTREKSIVEEVFGSRGAGGRDVTLADAAAAVERNVTSMADRLDGTGTFEKSSLGQIFGTNDATKRKLDEQAKTQAEILRLLNRALPEIARGAAFG